MQFDSNAEITYRSFLQYYQAALGIHLSKTLRYVYLFFIVRITFIYCTLNDFKNAPLFKIVCRRMNKVINYTYVTDQLFEL